MGIINPYLKVFYNPVRMNVHQVSTRVLRIFYLQPLSTCRRLTHPRIRMSVQSLLIY